MIDYIAGYIAGLFPDLTPFRITTLTIGFFGQGLFFMRFLLQWLCSEKEKKSVVPVVFWYFSLGGGICLLTYAILNRDPVIILGNMTGSLIYLRNIYFIHREKKLNVSHA